MVACVSIHACNTWLTVALCFCLPEHLGDVLPDVLSCCLRVPILICQLQYRSARTRKAAACPHWGSMPAHSVAVCLLTMALLDVQVKKRMTLEEFVRNNRQLVVTIAAVAAGITAAGAILVGLGGAVTMLGFALSGLATAIGAAMGWAGTWSHSNVKPAT